MEERNWLAFPVVEQIRITNMYSLFKRHYDCGYAFQGESHNFWECLYVLEGNLCVSADERVYNLTSGEIIFHKPMEFHKFMVQSDKGADLFIFSFSAEGPLTDLLRDKVFLLSRDQKALCMNLLFYLHSKSSASGLSEKNFYNYLRPFRHLPQYSQMVSTYLCQLFLSLADEGNVSSVSHAPDAVIFSRTVHYLNSNLHRQPTVAEIAGYSNVSISTIKRIFDKYAGISVHKYLLKLKIKAAMELLQNGESVSTAAAELGFNSQSYFSKAFKRETGENPSNFRS